MNLYCPATAPHFCKLRSLQNPTTIPPGSIFLLVKLLPTLEPIRGFQNFPNPKAVHLAGVQEPTAALASNNKQGILKTLCTPLQDKFSKGFGAGCSARSPVSPRVSRRGRPLLFSPLPLPHPSSSPTASASALPHTPPCKYAKGQQLIQTPAMKTGFVSGWDSTKHSSIRYYLDDRSARIALHGS